ncbi:MAG: NAD(P)H-hydrate dehydratase [Lachnospiraceae bacterium]|nr:NAD(P)H-hydrate dehydratase [Lachnospiraceae bacterium]
MKYVVTAEEMRQYDKNTIEKIGLPGMVLMERAAIAAFELVWMRKPENVLIIAGMGNNGGDGLALARLLSERGIQTCVWCVGDKDRASDQWKQQYEILQNYSVDFCNEAPIKEYSIIVDALFGVGLSREITGIYENAVSYINTRRSFKMSLDVPSGICSDTGKILGCAVKADCTVTFGFLKRGMLLYPGCEYAGEIHVADIGIGSASFFGKEPDMFCYEEAAEELLPERIPSGNKGTFGKLLLIAGSVNMAGAAILAAKSAYRVGAGMVKVLSPQENREIIQRSIPDAMYGTYEDLEASLAWADILAIGPGLSMSPKAKEVLARVITDSKLPLILDADALNILAADKQMQHQLSEQGKAGRAIILTPHMGELSRLLSLQITDLKEKPWEYGMKLAKELHSTVVVKDARSFICMDGYPVCINTKGNSGMAVAGSGDVLCGIIAGLLAQKADCFKAASAGVYLHGITGDKVALTRGVHGMMASDIADSI